MEEEKTMWRLFRPREYRGQNKRHDFLKEDKEREERICLLSHLLLPALSHVEGLREFLPERCFAIFSNGVLAIWKNRETFLLFLLLLCVSVPQAWYSRRVVKVLFRAEVATI
jgi:hypothetical protein